MIADFDTQTSNGLYTQIKTITKDVLIIQNALTEDKVYSVNNPDGTLATIEYVDEKVDEIVIPEVPSLERYATETYVDEKIAEIEIPEIPEIPDLTGYATETYVDNNFVNKTDVYNPQISLPEVEQDTKLVNKGYVGTTLTNYPDITNVGNMITQALNNSNFALKSHIFRAGNTTQNIAIGGAVTTTSLTSLTIGKGTTNSGENSILIGEKISCGYADNIIIGHNIVASQATQIRIGDSNYLSIRLGRLLITIDDTTVVLKNMSSTKTLTLTLN
jgi:hypothetical protein